jgi:hypothetical protein
MIPAAIAQMVRSQLLQKNVLCNVVSLVGCSSTRIKHSTEILLVISVLDDNTEVIKSKLDALLLNFFNDTVFVDAFNAVLGTLNVVSVLMCVNSCETCMNGACGILEYSEEYVASELGNYTYDEIVAGNKKYFDLDYTFLGCIDYTTNGYGKVCFGYEYYVTGNLDDASCYFESNGVQCNSCVELLEDNNCYFADCTNIESTAMIDTCNGTGFVGPFTFLQYFFDNPAMVTNSTFTVGGCDIVRSPTSPTGIPNATTPTVNSAIGLERPTSNIDSGALSLAAIFGIAAGGTAGLFLMACGGYALGRRRRKDTDTGSDDQKGTTNFQEDAGITYNDISEPHIGNVIDRNNNDSETIQIPSGLVVALPAQAHIDDTNTSNIKGSETIQIPSRLVVQVLPQSRIHDTSPDYEVSQKDQCRSVVGEKVRIVNAVAMPNRNKSEKM